MGLDYAIDLYFPIEKIKDALLETVCMSVPHLYEEGRVTLMLLDGEILDLPYTSHLKAAQFQLKKNSGNYQFDTVLLFPTDTILQTYNQYRNEFPSATYKDGYEEIGYIYLYLHLGERYVRFRFWAATSDMSRLFLRSKTIHNTMAKLLHSAGGLIGLIMVERSEYPLLENASQKIDIVEFDYIRTEEEYYRDGHSDIDRFVEAILKAPQTNFQPKEYE
jgi:hypothetical protein